MVQTSRSALRPIPHSSRDEIADRANARQDAEETKRAGAGDFFAVDQDREFAVAPRDRLDLDGKVPPQCGRHTGGLDPGHSITAAADGNAHHSLPATQPAASMNAVSSTENPAMKTACTDAGRPFR